MKSRILHITIGLLLVALFPSMASAQMFSVEEEQQRRQRVGPVNNVYVGWEPTDFSYYGPAQTDRQRTSYAMNSPLFRIRYESFGTELFVGFADDVTGSDTVDFFHIGGKVSRGLPLVRSKYFRLNIPIELQADLTLASNEYSLSEKFQQSNVLVGAGAGMGVNISPKLRWNLSFIPKIGYSLSPGGTFGGATYQFNGQTRLSLLKLFGSVGLSFGYDYTYKKYDISVNRFDYTLRSHSVLIGVNF